MKLPLLAAGATAAALAAATLIAVPASAETGVTDDTIKIGALGVLTGPNAKFGDTIYNGVETVYKEANAAGGIHGRTIEYVREDDRCRASEAVGAVKKLIHQHEVFMIHGGACSNASLAAKPEIEAADIPWVITASTASTLTEPVHPRIFTTMLAGWMESYAQVQYAIDRGMKRIAIVAQLDNWGRRPLRPAHRGVQAAGHRTVADEEIAPDPSDATPQALRVQAAEADAVILILFPKAAAVVVRDLYKIGYQPFLIGGSTVGDVGVFASNVGIPARRTTSTRSPPSDTPRTIRPWPIGRRKSKPPIRTTRSTSTTCSGSRAGSSWWRRSGRRAPTSPANR